LEVIRITITGVSIIEKLINQLVKKTKQQAILKTKSSSAEKHSTVVERSKNPCWNE
jgi:hypothetical protein